MKHLILTKKIIVLAFFALLVVQCQKDNVDLDSESNNKNNLSDFLKEPRTEVERSEARKRAIEIFNSKRFTDLFTAINLHVAQVEKRELGVETTTLKNDIESLIEEFNVENPEYRTNSFIRKIILEQMNQHDMVFGGDELKKKALKTCKTDSWKQFGYCKNKAATPFIMGEITKAEFDKRVAKGRKTAKNCEKRC